VGARPAYLVASKQAAATIGLTDAALRQQRHREVGIPYVRLGGRVFYSIYRVELERLKRRAHLQGGCAG
jgi:hypothetical protein